MVKIRLSRTGATHSPHYRVVVIDSKKSRDGGYIENLGHYDPRGKTELALGLNAERAKYWLSVGAQPTERARKLLVKIGVLERTVQNYEKLAAKAAQAAAKA